MSHLPAVRPLLNGRARLCSNVEEEIPSPRKAGARGPSTIAHGHLAVLPVVMALFALLSVDALALDQKAINDRVTDLKLMSPLERNRLNRNIQDFQSLSSSQKAQFRNLHAELIDDRTHAGGLTALMQTYSAWLNSLTPAQREEIKNETDAARKLEIVRRIKEETDHPKESHETSPDAATVMPISRPPSKGVMDAKDLVAILKTVVERLPQNRMRPEFERPQLESYLPIINASIQMSPSPKEWPDETLLPKMIASIRSKEVQSMIQNSASKRDTLIRMLLMSIQKQAVESVRVPTDEERLQTFESLNPAEQQRIYNHSPQVVKQLLTIRYFEMKGDEQHKKLPEYRRQVIDMFERLEVPLPPWMARQRPRPQGRG